MPKDFYRLCPIEFDYALDDWERTYKEDSERYRSIIFHVFNSGFHIKKTLSKPSQLIGFDWDEKPEKIEFSEDYIKRIRERDKKVFKKHPELLKHGKDAKGTDNKN